MKQTINLGAYGWLQSHWINSFYPEDLPEEWRLGYYSNEFNTVLVPAEYWQHLDAAECEQWLDDVHPDFQFFIECHSRLFDSVSPAELTDALQVLKPQLSGLVFLDDQQMSSAAKTCFSRAAEELSLAVFGADISPEGQKVWHPGCSAGETAKAMQGTRFAVIEDELVDLRAARALIEPFTALLDDAEAAVSEAVMIVSHPRLQVADLAKFRSVLEIMGH